MKILFVGESWLGSCARSLREALARRPDVEMEDLGEDTCFPKPQARWLRVANRFAFATYRKEFNARILGCVESMRPDIALFYKGSQVHTDLLRAIRRTDTPVVNVYPDYSPHAHGTAHRKAVGEYDLIVSTKSYHPALWHSVYGYQNRCVFAPQGYDPTLHLVTTPPAAFDFDVVLVATYRHEYGQLMVNLGRALNDPNINVAIGGHGWEAMRAALPAHWRLLGAVVGHEYIARLRQGRICVAPLTRNASVNGRSQPGDVDTTRTYELAAANCFFVHRRTDYVQTLYDEATEVPMFDDANELARHIRYYLAHPERREAMAAAAHRRAVPAYSVDQRASELLAIVTEHLRS